MPTPSSVERLAREHSIEGARWRSGPGDFALLEIETGCCRAVLTPDGGQLCEWSPAGEREPVVFRSPHAAFVHGKAIRGGVPICFPWFGDHPTDRAKPAHGFARTREWQVAGLSRAEDDVRVRFRLAADETTRALWDAEFEADLEIVLGATATLRFELENRGSRPLDAEVALHTYLGVSHVEEIRIHGLERTRFLDKVDGGREKRQAGVPLTIRGEVDRVFLDTPTCVEVEDPGLARRIRIEKSGSLATVVWNPGAEKGARMGDVGGAWSRFVCVETAACGPHALHLPPGARATVTSRISVAPL